MDPIEATVRYDLEGKILPLRFTWQGKVYPVTSTGRRWKDENGNLHILVMIPGDHVRELIFVPSAGLWYLGSFGRQRVA